MKNLSAIQKVVDELKRNKNITLKTIAEELQLSYQHVSRQTTGHTKFSDSFYDKLMKYAKSKGIDVPIDNNSYIAMEELTQYTGVEKSSSNNNDFEIVVRVRLTNNEISGVVWAKELIKN